MSIRVLIVEDDPDLLAFYVDALEMAGHLVFASARNGVEALEILTASDEFPDVIIMDHRMPIKSGLDTAQEILQCHPGARIIFASADDGAEQEALSLGVTCFKKKPFTLASLLESIELALDG